MSTKMSSLETLFWSVACGVRFDIDEVTHGERELIESSEDTSMGTLSGIDSGSASSGKWLKKSGSGAGFNRRSAANSELVENSCRDGSDSIRERTPSR